MRAAQGMARGGDLGEAAAAAVGLRAGQRAPSVVVSSSPSLGQMSW
jgi:hypothetical protein